jgi:hypothetical protein
LSIGRDLLSLLVRANMAVDLPADQRLSDRNMLARAWRSSSTSPWFRQPIEIPTFLATGAAITSTSTTWAIFSLAQHLDIQCRLREELLEVASETPSMGDLQALFLCIGWRFSRAE